MICCLGAGPGDLGYLTQRGRELIETADVVAGFRAVVDLVRPLVGERVQDRHHGLQGSGGNAAEGSFAAPSGC